ncbi:10803_t:CDS:2, partial [Cetraspora pellucida]
INSSDTLHNTGSLNSFDNAHSSHSFDNAHSGRHFADIITEKQNFHIAMH